MDEFITNIARAHYHIISLYNQTQDYFPSPWGAEQRSRQAIIPQLGHFSKWVIGLATKGDLQKMYSIIQALDSYSQAQATNEAEFCEDVAHYMEVTNERS